MDKNILVNKNILVVSHAFIAGDQFGIRSGPVQPLMDYFKDKINFFFLIGQPPPYTKGSLAPFMFIYKKGELLGKIYLKKFNFLFNIPNDKRKVKTYMRLKIVDFISVLYFSKIIKTKYLKKQSIWLSFGVESVNAVAAICIRKLLNIESVVYYIFDWSPRWFKNRFFNFLYILFDKYASYHADFIWDITHTITRARIEILRYDKEKMGKQLTVPYGMPFRKSLVKEAPIKSTDTIIYSGYLSVENGAMLLPEIAFEVAKLDKNIKIIVLGGGDKLDFIKKKICEYKLSNIFLKGSFEDQSKIDAILVKAHIAISPYKYSPYSKKKYGDVIKIRNYFACGLPVVTTNVVPVADEIYKEQLGVVCDYDAEKFARICFDLFRDNQLYNKFRLNVINKSKKHSWQNVYSVALQQMFS